MDNERNEEANGAANQAQVRAIAATPNAPRLAYSLSIVLNLNLKLTLLVLSSKLFLIYSILFS
jgi:hypothetical protein